MSTPALGRSHSDVIKLARLIVIPKGERDDAWMQDYNALRTNLGPLNFNSAVAMVKVWNDDGLVEWVATHPDKAVAAPKADEGRKKAKRARRIASGHATEEDWKAHVEDLGADLAPAGELLAQTMFDPSAIPFEGEPAPKIETFTPADVAGEAERQAAETLGDVDPEWALPSKLSRSLLDIEFRPPPPPLVDPFLAPEGWTVLYAPGGTGKGFVSLWLIRQLIKLGMKVVIIDFESHENEWRSRAELMGFTRNEQSRIVYVAPFVYWEGEAGSLREIAPKLTDDFLRPDRQVDYAFVDSFTFATGDDDGAMGGKRAATEFYEGTKVLGLPGAVLAHTRADAERLPAKPFGSVHILNGAREAWAYAKDYDRSQQQTETAPGRLVIETRNTKRNEGAQPVKHEFFTFEFADGRITADRSDIHVERPLIDMATAVLARSIKALDIKTLARIIAADEAPDGKTPDAETLRRTIDRHSDRIDKLETSPVTYRIHKDEVTE